MSQEKCSIIWVPLTAGVGHYSGIYAAEMTPWYCVYVVAEGLVVVRPTHRSGREWLT